MDQHLLSNPVYIKPGTIDIQSTLEDKEFDIQYEIRLITLLSRNQRLSMELFLQDDVSDEIKQYLVVGMENNWETLGNLFGRLFTKIYNLSFRTYKAIRNKIDDSRHYMSSVTDSWENRIKSNLNQISDDVLSEEDMELFSVDKWIQTAKVTLRLFEFASKVDDVCNDTNTDAITNYMKEIKNTASNIGVEVSISRLSSNYDDLLDDRKYQSLSALGYHKSMYPNIFRYMGQLARYIPSNDQDSPIAKKINAYLKQMTVEASNLRDSFNKGKIKKENGEYQARNDQIVNRMMRAGYVLCILDTAFGLTKILLKDSMKMFSTVEDLIKIKK